MIKPPSLLKGSCKISPVHLSVCPFVSDAFFLEYTLDFLSSLHEGILQYVLQSDKARFCNIVFVV